MNERKPYIHKGYIAYYNVKDNNYDYEHDLVIENKLNRKLKPNEVVHHLDLNKFNNNIENLIYLENSQHSKLHSWINNGCPINKKNNITTIKDALKESKRCRRCGCINIVKDARNNYCSIQCRIIDINQNGIMLRTNKENNPRKGLITYWPNIDILVKKVNKQGYVKTAKELNVSDKAVAKRIQKFNRQDEIIDFRKKKKE